MKFKFNYCEKRLWKLEEDYSSEISEENYFHKQQGKYHSDGFLLGENKWILFIYQAEEIKVFYKANSLIYQKTLELPQNLEITFAFSKEDQTGKDEQTNLKRK